VYWRFVFGGLGSLFLLDAGEMRTVFADGRMILVALGLIVISTVLPYLLYTNGLARVESGKASILNSTSKCGQYLVPFFHGEQEEVVYLLCLDAKCKALCCVPVHRGSITVASISVRKIVQTALNQNAASVVLAHNHPSGYALPSQEDLDTTRTLQTALQSVGIVLADHIIVADDDYVSLADDGYLGGSYGL